MQHQADPSLHPSEQQSLRRSEPDGPIRVVVIGAGFAGLSAAQSLSHMQVALTVIDQRNHHLFQPLLYQVATAGLSPADIATPIRRLFSGRRNVRVLLGQVTGVDTLAREVLLDEKRVQYDVLVVATGARHAYFGHDDWEKFAPGLKQIEDATSIRRRILIAFEHAEAEGDPDERRRLLTFAVIGAGPTGVELAGAIAELAKVALARDFRTIDPLGARIMLIQATDRVLPTFPSTLSQKARDSLAALGVEVRTGTAVTECTARHATVGTEQIAAGTILWAAGVMASPAAAWLHAGHDGAGRVIVERNLTLPDHPDIFVIGDTACVPGSDGKPLPGVAPVAKQQGVYVAQAIRARLTGASVAPFRYRHLGSLATIGRGRAVADFGWRGCCGAWSTSPS
jgi:NADH dehydrogenase